MWSCAVSPNTMFGSSLFSDRLKSCMVAERCLSAPAACDWNSPCATPTAMAEVAIRAAIESEIFTLTYIAQYAESVREEVIGDILQGFTCKALVCGQCLMIVGGFVVRGVQLACGRRAKAIRRPDGRFERVNPGSCCLAITNGEPTEILALPNGEPLATVAGESTTTTTRPTQPPQRPQLQPTHHADDLASAASSICLAIQGTPSPEGNLLPKLEAQAEVENSELPFQERRELFEANKQLQFEQDTVG